MRARGGGSGDGYSDESFETAEEEQEHQEGGGQREAPGSGRGREHGRRGVAPPPRVSESTASVNTLHGACAEP